MDDFETVKAKDLEDLLNQKTRAVTQKKALQIHRLLYILRNQAIACIVSCDVLFGGIILYQFELSLMICIFSVLGIKLASAILTLLSSRKK